MRAAKKGPAAKKSAAAKRPATKPAAAGGAGLLTLTEVSKRTGISMPTLQRYKREYQKRLQTVGKGRTQRYKEASLDTFKAIKEENLKKRGRPRKVVAKKAVPAARAKARPAAAAKKARSAAAPKAAPKGLISLSEIGRRTGISYPTLLRYVRLHADRIPSHGSGRKRRFPPAAVPIFSQLRKESRRGRRKGTSAKKASAAVGGQEARLRRLEKSHAELERQLKKLVKILRQPMLR
jgi:DNA-binding transcriptional MerR regulator